MQDEFFFPAINHVREMGFCAIDPICGGGIVKPLAEAGQNFNRSPLIRYWQHSAETSIKKNGSEVLIVIAHEGCKGNPVSEQIQKNQLLYAKEALNSFGLNVPIILLWQNENQIFETL